MIDIQNLNFGYKEDLILNDISMHFAKGRFSIILGRNGSGKSTLFKVMTGVEKKYSGALYINGIERRDIQLGNKSQPRLGFLPQFHQTTFPFSVMDVVLTGRSSFFKFSPNTEDKVIVEDILRKFHLWNYKDKDYTSLSGGERQLVLLSRVLVQKPDVLLLDEPTNHLDLHYQIAVLDVIRDLVDEGNTVLCVMHDPNLAFMYGDDIYVMNNKKLISLDKLDETEIHQLLEETYKLPLVASSNQDILMFTPKKRKRDNQ